MADLATRLFGEQRPVPTGNTLQTPPAAMDFTVVARGKM